MVLDIIENSFGIIRKQPKVLLPYVINLIPAILITGMLYFFIQDMLPLIAGEYSTELVYSLLAKYAIPFVVFMLISFLIGAFVSGFYPDMARQAFTKRSIMLSESLAVAKKKFGAILWTSTILILLIMPVSAAWFVLLFVPVIGIFLFLVASVVILSAAIPGLYMIMPVVVLENLSGLAAIKRSFALARNRKLSIWGINIVMGIIAVVLHFLEYVPYLGLVLSPLIAMFLVSWMMLAVTTYYFMRIKNKSKLALK